jgi:hypothetical protein
MVTDAYGALKSLVKGRLGSGASAELVLAKHEDAPDAWQGALTAELANAGADADHELIAAARAFLDLVGNGGAGKYRVDARGAQGLQVGSYNRQDNVFNAPPGGQSAGNDS